MNHIHKCNSCNLYTLEKKCPRCNHDTLEPRPPKFSLDDRFTSYRRQVKEPDRKKQGLL